jgi:hypothetical protein
MIRTMAALLLADCRCTPNPLTQISYGRDAHRPASEAPDNVRTADHLYGGFAVRQSTINGADRVGIYPYFSKLYLDMLIGSGDCLGMAVCSRETALRYTSVD